MEEQVMEAVSETAVDAWLKTTLTYGIASVFLSLFCAIVLWFVWMLARRGIAFITTLIEWLPKWFQAQIGSHEAVSKSANTLATSLTDVQKVTTQNLEASWTTHEMICDIADAGIVGSRDPRVHEHLTRAKSRPKER